MLGWFAETTLVAAGLAALAVLAGRSLRLAPEARHALWLVVLAKFLIPPVVAWPWGAVDSSTIRRPIAETRAEPRPRLSAIAPPLEVAFAPLPLTPPIPETREPATGLADPELPDDPFLAESASPVVWDARQDREPASLPTAPDPPRPAPSGWVRTVVAPWLDGSMLLMIGWGVGAVVVAARGVARIARFRRTLTRASAAPGWLVEEVASVGNRLGVKPPPVLVSPGLPTPLLWCLGAPRLVVPESLGRMTPDTRSGLIAHELAHLVRWDHWVVRLELLAGLIWWWNPVFRFARRRLRDEAEAACDARVVRAFPHHRFAYAEALVQVCEHHARPVPPLPALGIGGAWAARTLEARLTMILRDPIRPPSRRVSFGALTLLALSLPSWTLGRQEPAKPADPPKVETPQTVAPAKPTKAESASDSPREEAPTRGELGQKQGGLDGATTLETPKAEVAGVQKELSSPIGLLEARRKTQVAEVAMYQAQFDLIAGAYSMANSSFQANQLGQETLDRFTAKFKIAELELAREKAKLAETNLLLKQASAAGSVPNLLLDQAPPTAQTSTRDSGQTALLQARRDAQAAELRRFEAERDRAKTSVDRKAGLVARMAIEQRVLDEAQADLRAAEAAVDREKFKLTEADLLLDQANAAPVLDRKTTSNRGQTALLQARRDAQVAELRRSEAERRLAKTVVDRNDSLLKKNPNYVSPEENAAAQAKLQIAEAAVDREKAKLAEADLLLDQANAAPIPDRETTSNRGQTALLQARRDAQAAEVQKFEAKNERAAADSRRADALLQRSAIGRDEYDRIKADFEVGKAEVSREKAKLAEADAMLDQAKRTPSTDPEPLVVGTQSSLILSDYRDLADLVEVQLQGKRAELHGAATKANQAKTRMNSRRILANEGKITQGQLLELEETYETAQEDRKTKEVEVLEAELRLKQAKRRADFEEARLKRLAERTKVELDRAKELYQRKITGAFPVFQVQGRFDDLMLQLDPNYKPEPSPPENPASGAQPEKSPR